MAEIGTVSRQRGARDSPGIISKIATRVKEFLSSEDMQAAWDITTKPWDTDPSGFSDAMRFYEETRERMQKEAERDMPASSGVVDALKNLGKSAWNYAKAQPVSTYIEAGKKIAPWAAAPLAAYGTYEAMSGNGNGFVPQGPPLSAAPMNVQQQYYQTQKRNGRKLYPYLDPFGNLYYRVKPRRMNPLNPRALARAHKRVMAFEDFVKTNFRIIHHSKVKPKKRRRRRKC